MIPSDWAGVSCSAVHRPRKMLRAEDTGFGKTMLAGVIFALRSVNEPYPARGVQSEHRSPSSSAEFPPGELIKIHVLIRALFSQPRRREAHTLPDSRITINKVCPSLIRVKPGLSQIQEQAWSTTITNV